MVIVLSSFLYIFFFYIDYVCSVLWNRYKTPQRGTYSVSIWIFFFCSKKKKEDLARNETHTYYCDDLYSHMEIKYHRWIDFVVVIIQQKGLLFCLLSKWRKRQQYQCLDYFYRLNKEINQIKKRIHISIVINTENVHSNIFFLMSISFIYSNGMCNISMMTKIYFADQKKTKKFYLCLFYFCSRLFSNRVVKINHNLFRS